MASRHQTLDGVSFSKKKNDDQNLIGQRDKINKKQWYFIQKTDMTKTIYVFANKKTKLKEKTGWDSKSNNIFWKQNSEKSWLNTPNSSKDWLRSHSHWKIIEIWQKRASEREKNKNFMSSSQKRIVKGQKEELSNDNIKKDKLRVIKRPIVPIIFGTKWQGNKKNIKRGRNFEKKSH